MNNSKDNKTENLNSSDMTKKTSLPLLVGTGVIIIAGVMSCDANISTQVNNMIINNTISAYSQNTQTQVDLDDSSKSKKKVVNKNKSYIKNDTGELFYDSDAEDDEAYYGNWIKDDYDDDDDFIISVLLYK